MTSRTSKNVENLSQPPLESSLLSDLFPIMFSCLVTLYVSSLSPFCSYPKQDVFRKQPFLITKAKFNKNPM